MRQTVGIAGNPIDRVIALGRALMLGTKLIILDEPFQGLDAAFILRARAWIDRHLNPEQTLLFVSHYPEEIPRTVTRRLRLDAGRIVELV